MKKKFVYDAGTVLKYPAMLVTSPLICRAKTRPANAALSVSLESYDDSTDSLVVNEPVEKGMSGGPFVNDGVLVGVLFATSGEKHKSYVVPISAFREFIERIIGEAEDDDFGYQPNAAPTIPLMEVKRWFWWMDREMQISQLARSLSSRSAAAPVFAVVRCRSDDHHRFLRHRLERGEDTFDSNSPYANMLPGIPVHDVEFPGESENAKASLTSMQERLRSQIMGASTKTTDVVEAFNSAQSPQCVFSTVVCEGGLLSAAQAELLAGWLENWKAIGGAPNRALNHPVLVLVFIVCDTESAELPKRSLLDWVMGRQKAYVDPNEWLDGLTNAKHNHVAVQRFENLGTVPRSEVEAWIKVLATHYHALRSMLDIAVTELQTLIPEGGVRMSDIEQQLTRLSMVRKD